MTSGVLVGLGCMLMANMAAQASEAVRVPWKRVAVLVNDAEVTIIRTNARKKVTGRVMSVGPDSIQLSTQSGQASIASLEIARIQVHRRSKGPAGALVGAASGAAIAALFAHPSKPLFKDGGIYTRNADGTSTKVDTSPHPNYGLAAAAGAGIGGLAGWLASRSRGSRAITLEIVPDKPPADPAEAIGGKAK